MAERQVKVGILITARNLAGGVVTGFQKSLGGLRESLFSVKALMVSIASGAAVQLTRALFRIGAEAGETESKFRTVFGKAAEEVQKFNDTFGRIAGLSKTQAREITATTGAIAQGMGFAEDASAKFAIQVTRLAGDIGSFNNLPTADVIHRINAALTGERESLKRLGIVILETDVQRRAFLNTGKKTVDQLTQQEKATATLELITEKAGRAVGDLERTQHSMANQAKRLNGELKTTVERMGELFVKTFETSGGFGQTGDRIRSFNELLDKNEGKIVKWGVVVIRVIQFVISALGGLVRIAFNVGQIVGETIRFIFDGLLKEGKVLGQLFLGLVTRDTAGIAKALRELGDLGDLGDDWDRFLEGQKTNFKDLGATIDGAAESLANLSKALVEGTGLDSAGTSTAPPPGGGGGGGGGGAKVGPRRIHPGERNVAFGDLTREGATLEEQTKLLEAASKAGASLAMLPQIRLFSPDQVTLAEQIGQQLVSIRQGFSLLADTVDNITFGVMEGFQNAVTDAFDALVSGSGNAAKAFQKAMLSAIANIAARQGQLFFAEGLAAVGRGLLGHPGAFAAAAKFFAAATAMFALSGAIGAAARGGGGGGGTSSDRAQAAADELGEDGGEATILIEGGILDTDDTRQMDQLARAIETITGRRMVIKRGTLE